MNRIGAALAAVMLLVPLAACTVSGTVVATETVEEHIEVESGPLISVETFNGRISVVTGSDTMIDARIVKRGSGTSQAEAERDLRQLVIDVVEDPGRVTIAVRRADAPVSLGNIGADIELAVPIDSSLELRTSNGRIESANVRGSIVARSSNSGVTIRDGTDVDAETSNGPLTVNAASGELKLRTSNGALDIIGAQDALVTAETMNGPITFSGTPAPGAHAFRTTNAPINLALPVDAEFTMIGHTSNATIRTAFPTLLVLEDSITGRVGDDPEVAIRADTSNGDLTVTSQP